MQLRQLNNTTTELSIEVGMRCPIPDNFVRVIVQRSPRLLSLSVETQRLSMESMRLIASSLYMLEKLELRTDNLEELGLLTSIESLKHLVLKFFISPDSAIGKVLKLNNLRRL
jgi:hypothetical protein